MTTSTRRFAATSAAWTATLVGLSRYVAWDRFRGHVDPVTEVLFYVEMTCVALLLLATLGACCWTLRLIIAEWLPPPLKRRRIRRKAPSS